ncbi:hypothetical protein OV090_42735 [Nannocystis sp. RBIL2]|uniref:hypothetical protein n=1 Tax=Nannocystis sp. RBIL2 TaxID=2996788 RepID=UPI00226DC6BA|nr:hypothetical protein [Nannocystis sp. RBIL2]MCY1071537.1 hypothetical protein [Nannocystis sp. RBIL2]
MKGQYVVTDVDAVIKPTRPTAVMWNRLEGRPRTADFDRALKAEVRDALWMLTRQWQTGEYQGEDAGWPVFAKIHMHTTPLTKYRSEGGAPEALSLAAPLEAKVEQLPIQWSASGQKMHLDMRAQIGRQWRRMLSAAGLGAYEVQFREKYRFEVPTADAASAPVSAHRGAVQQYAALAGRCIDGGELYLYLVGQAGAPRASDGITTGSAVDEAALDELGDELVKWFASIYRVPAAEAAWKPASLEYAFACSVQKKGAEKVLAADEYAHGHLDWYAFDHDPGEPGFGPLPALLPPESPVTRSFIPTPVAFEGMPDTRWWALEDRKTDFGDVKPSTTDLAQLLLIEFGLVYANDWFLVPFRLPAGTLAEVEGMAVTNSFGERFWLKAAGKGNDQSWHRWNMYTLSVKGDDPVEADTSLLLPPCTAPSQEGRPLEDVHLVRDEMANMVWAIEAVIPGVTGQGQSGSEAAEETAKYHRDRVGASEPAESEDYAAAISYRAMTSVPEHWIPFVPVHVPGSNREVQLQRSRMPRTIAGDPAPEPALIEPRTGLLRPGLDGGPVAKFFVHEEEVPRAGIRVTKSFQRTRATNGEAHVWLGVRKQVGRGERSSGLSFDDIVDVEKSE